MSLDRQQLFLFSFLPLLSAQMRLPFEIAPAPTFSNLSAPFEIPVARAFYSIKLSAHPWPSSKVHCVTLHQLRSCIPLHRFH